MELPSINDLAETPPLYASHKLSQRQSK